MNDKKRIICIWPTVIFLYVFLVSLFIPIQAHSAVLYKSYVVRQDKGRDILCDPYFVQKDDFVLKLFRERGEISEKDFPEFLNIFRRLNPHIRNINRILPGQQILIPLKKLNQDAMPGQSTGIVTIPFVTISDVTELLKHYAVVHTVKQGDSVSKLLSRQFGDLDYRNYQNAIQLFRHLNPGIKDIDRIYPGQVLYLPDTAIRKEPWYASLMNDFDQVTNQVVLNNLILSDETIDQPAEKREKEETAHGLAGIASLLDSKLFDKGRYFFPDKGNGDVELDLNRFPVMESNDGSRIIFSGKGSLSDADLATIKSYWKNAVFAPISADASDDQIIDTVLRSLNKENIRDHLSFSDGGIEVTIRAKWIFDEPGAEGKAIRRICITPVEATEERMPEIIARYLRKKNIYVKEKYADNVNTPSDALKNPQHAPPAESMISIFASDQRMLVEKLLSILRYPYSPKGTITFPYAGVQIQAVANIILKENSNPLLVDFGDFHGDAMQALSDSGFNLIQIKREDTYHQVIEKLLYALDVTFSSNPEFFAAEKSGEYHTTFQIPGVLVSDENTSKILITESMLPEEVVQFLNTENIEIIALQKERAKT